MTSDCQTCHSYDFAGKIPQFFKIILENTITQRRLEIPSGFVKKFGNCLWSPIILEVPNGRTWQVELLKIGDEVWLERGWQEFSEYHSLKHGHLLVFKYEGNCHFNVHIFDMSAVEIEYPMGKEKSRYKNILHSDFPIQESGGNLATGPLTALEIADNFTSSNPWFKVVFKYRSQQYTQSIPISFFRKHMECELQTVMVKVAHKSWPVKLQVYLHSRAVSLGGGWSAFARENYLERGDVCIFELISRNILNVSIFRNHC